MDSVQSFIKLSRYIGERFDLVQAGGGNTSVKTSNTEMYIKSSGYLLSEMTMSKGFSVVRTEEVKAVLKDPLIIDIKDKRNRDSEAGKRIMDTVIEGDRPSIETFLHALMDKYTAHVHSIAINALTSRHDWKDKLKAICVDAIYVDYKTPGMELALEMKNQTDSYIHENGVKPNVVFLQNHGLIVSYDDIEKVYSTMEAIVSKAEKIAMMDLAKYKLTNIITDLVRKFSETNAISYLTEDMKIIDSLYNQKQLFSVLPFCPDGLVYCGYEAVAIDHIENVLPMENYVSKYHETPKVILYKNECFIIANDLKKAKLIEDVLKNNLMILESTGDKTNILDDSELAYLGNWEAEKYRQSM